MMTLLYALLSILIFGLGFALGVVINSYWAETKPKQELVDMSEKEYLTSLIPVLPDYPPQLHQYKNLVIKTEKKKKRWHHEIWSNDMSKKLIVGNSLAPDSRSYDELIRDIEQDIDLYLKTQK